jgi:hypothetical protein
MSLVNRLLSLFQISRRWDYTECAKGLESGATKGMLVELKRFCSSCDSSEHSPLNPAQQKLWSRFNRILQEDSSLSALRTPEAHIGAGILTAIELHWALLELIPVLFQHEFARPPNRLEALELCRKLPIFLRSLAALSHEILVALDRRIVIRFPYRGKLYFAGLRPETLQLDRSSGIVSIKPDIINAILRDPPNQDTEMTGCPVLALAGVFKGAGELQLAAAQKYLLPLLELPLRGRILLRIGNWVGVVARSYSRAWDYCFEVLAEKTP